MAYRVPAAWTRLAWVSAVLMAVASGAGVFVEGVYAKEAPSWATQGVGQDIANLFVVFPVTIVAAWLAGRGSIRAALVLAGAMLYIAYSYVLYAFFVHFGPLFPVYVATQGCSFFALAGMTGHLLRDEGSSWFGPRVPRRAPAVFLMLFGVLFAMLWLSEIVPALLAGQTPASVEEARLPVNPVHVLDLAIVLPAMMVTSVALWRRQLNGYVFAAPLLVFAVLMGIAIEAMAGLMYLSEIAVPAAMPAIVAVVTIVGFALLVRFLRHVGETDGAREGPR